MVGKTTARKAAAMTNVRTVSMILAAASALTVGPAPGALANPAQAKRALPSLAACPPVKEVADAGLTRPGPLSIPKVWAGIARSDRTRIAFSTLAGGTVCIDAAWIDSIAEAGLSPGGRFAQFRWGGYEAAGFMIVDRSGKGVAFDTGDRPRPSPSGKQMAVVQYTEASFGSLEGFGVWQVDPAPMRERARLTFPDGLTQWRMDGWASETCVRISALRLEDLPENEADLAKAPRQRYVAHDRQGRWRIVPGNACPAR
jgi:hypothetical protein